MSRTALFAPGSWLILALALAPVALAGDESSEPRTITLIGEARLLPEVLRVEGVTADADPVAGQVVIRSEDGRITPLLSDTASRALFRDERLRQGRVRVEGRRLPGLPYLQVTRFQVEREGEFHTPEYHCDVCSIDVRFPQPCPCCQAEMVLRWKSDEH